MDIETLNKAADNILNLNEDNIRVNCSGYESGINDAIKVINYLTHKEIEKQKENQKIRDVIYKNEGKTRVYQSALDDCQNYRHSCLSFPLENLGTSLTDLRYVVEVISDIYW